MTETKKKNRLIIFDADSIIFTVAWRFRAKKASNLVKISTNKFIADVLSNSGADDYIGFFALKSENDIKPNFRYTIDPEYKANRPETPDFVKKWRPTIHGEFINKWGFIGVEGMEADDAVAITAKHYRDDYDSITIATFDKDLKQIPDITFYNMKDHQQTEITELEAAYNFYYQMIMGDSGDNIKGIPGLGKAAAKRILKDAGSICELFIRTAREYFKYEDKLRKKIFKEKYEEVQAKIAEDADNGIKNDLSKLSEAQLKRRIRIMIKQDVSDAVEEVLPGGWKAYYKKQHGLLHMLTEPIEGFDIPEIRKNDFKTETSSTMTSKEALDDFLSI